MVRAALAALACLITICRAFSVPRPLRAVPRRVCAVTTDEGGPELTPALELRGGGVDLPRTKPKPVAVELSIDVAIFCLVYALREKSKRVASTPQLETGRVDAAALAGSRRRRGSGGVASTPQLETGRVDAAALAGSRRRRGSGGVASTPRLRNRVALTPRLRHGAGGSHCCGPGVKRGRVDAAATARSGRAGPDRLSIAKLRERQDLLPRRTRNGGADALCRIERGSIGHLHPSPEIRKRTTDVRRRRRGHRRHG